MIDFAIHGNACLIASQILKTIAGDMPELFNDAAQYHEMAAADMEDIRQAIAGPIARLLYDLGEQHRILAAMDARNRGKTLL